MNDVGLGELLLRMFISLAVVLAVVMAAYMIIRRRQGAGASPRRSARRSSTMGLLGRPRVGGGTGTAGRRAGLRVLGRVGVGRTSSVVAVQFAERVFMIGASEQGAPTVLAEMELDDWQRATQLPDEVTPVSRRSPAAGDADPSRPRDARPGFIDALREASTRRG